MTCTIDVTGVPVDWSNGLCQTALHMRRLATAAKYSATPRNYLSQTIARIFSAAAMARRVLLYDEYGLFIVRFIGVLALDASISKRSKPIARVAACRHRVVAAARGAKDRGVRARPSLEPSSFIVAADDRAGAAGVGHRVAAIGITPRQPQTHSSVLRTAANGRVVLTPAYSVARDRRQLSLSATSLDWMMTTTVIAIRQSLDYAAPTCCCVVRARQRPLWRRRHRAMLGVGPD